MSVFELDSDLVTGPIVPGAPVEPVLRIHEIQGHLMPGLNTRYQRLMGIDFAGHVALRLFLHRIAPDVTTMARAVELRNERRRALRRRAPRPVTPPLLSVSLSRGILGFLPGADEIRDPAFRAGMYRRSSLGDPPEPQLGAPSTWRMGGTDEDIPQVLLIVAADDADDLEAAAERWRTKATGGTVVYDETGQLLPGATEHFGFRDGVSQPGVRGRLSELDRHFLTRRYVHPDDALALTHSRPGQPLVWPGQFVFGYPAQDPIDAVQPLEPPVAGPAWMRDGSFLVFRRLRQDVAAFRAGIAELTQQIRDQAGINVPTERTAALLVGRWPRGTALTRNPDGDDAAPMDEQLSVNHFGFAERTWPVRVPYDRWVGQEELRPKPGLAERFSTIEGTNADEQGSRCPRFAHIRNVNPRDLTSDQGDAADMLTRLILRRGITYGEPYPADGIDDGGDRGLLFLAYQTSIVEQFETLNTRWMNRTGAPEGRSGHDLLVGQAHGGGGRRAWLTLGRKEVELRTERKWVTTAGGGYFFTPSISTLRRFAGDPN